MTAREFLYLHFKAEHQEDFGTDEKWVSTVCNAWMDDLSPKHRYDTMRSMIGDEELRKSRILDMSSGCGTFVFCGLMNGYDVYGIEPAKWKHGFNSLKAKEYRYPDTWMKRFFAGVGEYLPLNDETFDIVSTYQTLEHVQCHRKCFSEFHRVLRKGGYLFIRCPDYASFYEGHYRIPMLPLMNRSLFKAYLRALGRPTKGLDTISYTTKKMICDYLSEDYQVCDIRFSEVKSRICDKTRIDSELLTHGYLALSLVKNVFRRENIVDLFAIKK
jgi:ubiquinone/menaquinone biosynthesis C-methylase UbiE